MNIVVKRCLYIVGLGGGLLLAGAGVAAAEETPISVIGTVVGSVEAGSSGTDLLSVPLAVTGNAVAVLGSSDVADTLPTEGQSLEVAAVVGAVDVLRPVGEPDEPVLR